MDGGGNGHEIDVSNGYSKHFARVDGEFSINSCSDITGFVFRGGRKSTALFSTLRTWLRQQGRRASERNLRAGGHSEQNFRIRYGRNEFFYRGTKNDQGYQQFQLLFFCTLWIKNIDSSIKFLNIWMERERIRTTLSSMGPRTEASLTKHFVQKNSWESNLVANILIGTTWKVIKGEQTSYH